ncbi:hypothetical protein [Ralstonia sp. UBA689]|uniref:hypothetical protein n=1 Tax=Ralstonia sp. UBA689 TaxID=1947373 RepID=UPI0025E4783F|nr:hypothetical protein [Ralstonia sp. UBA689]
MTAPFATTPWFQSLPPRVAEALLEAAVPSGVLKLSIFNAEGDEAILTLVEPGNWFGGLSTLDLQPAATERSRWKRPKCWA